MGEREIDMAALLDIAKGIAQKARKKSEEIYEHTHFDDKPDIQRRLDDLTKTMIDTIAAVQIIIDIMEAESNSNE